jgi:hypothetical protein
MGYLAHDSDGYLGQMTVEVPPDISATDSTSAQPGDTTFVGPVEESPQPGSPDFVGPVQVTDTGTGSIFTLPVEVFQKVWPIVLQAGGVQPIQSPIPGTLPSGYGTSAKSYTPYLVFATVAYLLLFSGKRNR